MRAAARRSLHRMWRPSDGFDPHAPRPEDLHPGDLEVMHRADNRHPWFPGMRLAKTVYNDDGTVTYFLEYP